MPQKITVSEISALIEQFAPLTLQAPYDNCGLNIGARNAEVNGVLVVLDVTMRALETAVARGLNLIIAHHPVLFNPLRTITTDSACGRLVRKAIENGLCIYAGHTNVDNAKGGLCDQWAEKIGLFKTSPLLEDGTGRVGAFQKGITLKDVATKLQTELCNPNIRVSGDLNRVLKRGAVVNGSGGKEELIEAAVAAQADLYIASEMRYGSGLTLCQNDIAVIETDHYESEQHFIPFMETRLKDNFAELRIESFYDPLYLKERIYES